MNYKTIFLARAKKELLDAWFWYEERQIGLGDRFRNEIFKRIQVIEQNPERFPERKRHYRETMIRTFPFLIIYRIDKKERQVIISSIFHGRRNPKKKYRK
ncbi:MAG: type II toxin-antitoxin system RelE/ParE family toxin [Panacibacter sp.]